MVPTWYYEHHFFNSFFLSFNLRLTVPCSNPENVAELNCPVKIVGVASTGLGADQTPQMETNDQHRNFVFKQGETTVLDSEMELEMDATAADDLPALVLLARIDPMKNVFFQQEQQQQLQQHQQGRHKNGLQLFRFRFLQLGINGDNNDQSSSLLHFFGLYNLKTNPQCIWTFFTSFFLFLTGSVLISFLLLSWYDKYLSSAKPSSWTNTSDQGTSTSTMPPCIVKVDSSQRVKTNKISKVEDDEELLVPDGRV